VNKPRHRSSFVLQDGFLAARELLESGAPLGPVPVFFDDRPSGLRPPSQDGEKCFGEKVMIPVGLTGIFSGRALETPERVPDFMS